MFKNYFQTALNVLRRRPFLAFVNLFGVAVTLTVLIVIAALAKGTLRPDGAEAGKQPYLTINNVCFRGETSTWNSGPGWQFYQRYVSSLETPVLTSFFTGGSAGISYRDGARLEFIAKATDAAYWKILDFTFIEGRPIEQDDYDGGAAVAVINRSTARALYGSGSALGEQIRMNGKSYRIIGLVDNEPESGNAAFADVWVPLTSAASPRWQQEWLGSGRILVAIGDQNPRRVQSEFRAGLNVFKYDPAPEQYDRAFARANTRLDALATEAMDEYCSSDSKTAAFVASAGMLMLCFMLLPAINMVNLNVSRILERAPEIGVRKAMGATKKTLVGQFVFENLVITAIGGLLALGIAPLVLKTLNRTMLEYGDLAVDGYVAAVALLLIGIFGVLSGAYPAWRMARLEPTDALRGGGHRV